MPPTRSNRLSVLSLASFFVLLVLLVLLRSATHPATLPLVVKAYTYATYSNIEVSFRSDTRRNVPCGVCLPAEGPAVRGSWCWLCAEAPSARQQHPQQSSDLTGGLSISRVQQNRHLDNRYASSPCQSVVLARPAPPRRRRAKPRKKTSSTTTVKAFSTRFGRSLLAPDNSRTYNLGFVRLNWPKWRIAPWQWTRILPRWPRLWSPRCEPKRRA